MKITLHRDLFPCLLCLEFITGDKLALSFIDFSTVVALCLLTWSCVEVGGNDAANLVNAVLGSRVLRRKHAVVLAGIAVILGATFSSPVVDTVRKGIFDLGELNAEMAVSAFLASYLVGTVLLYSFSAFGMPVSTTATLVFSLSGASIGVTGSLQVVHWSQLGQVSFAIITSILMSGCASFFAQRIFRNAIKRDAQNHRVVLKHGPWITGLILMAMLWFMLVKGMRFLPFVEDLNTLMVGETSTVWLLLGMFASITIVTFLVLMLGSGDALSIPLYRYYGNALHGICLWSERLSQLRFSWSCHHADPAARVA